jgi:DNA-binding CsgD family transcriptional regulator
VTTNVIRSQDEAPEGLVATMEDAFAIANGTWPKKIYERTGGDTWRDRYFTLTPRERQIFYMMAQGYGRGDVARQLTLSPQTVSNYFGTIFKKFGVHSQRELLKMTIALTDLQALATQTPPKGRTT